MASIATEVPTKAAYQASALATLWARCSPATCQVLTAVLTTAITVPSVVLSVQAVATSIEIY